MVVMENMYQNINSQKVILQKRNIILKNQKAILSKNKAKPTHQQNNF